jgi:kelch-like protein 24/35
MDSSFEVGDVVRFSRGEYSHLAIYIGARRVIHLWSPTQEGFCVRVDAFDTISMDVGQTPENFTRHMDEKVRRNHQKEPLNGDEIVRRAMSRIDDTHYDVLTYNCEHFVTWARYDQCISLQVRSHANQVIAGALLGAVFAGTAGLIVGGIISLFTKKDALFASCNSISGNPQGVEQQEEEIRRRQETTRERRRRIWREIEAAQNEQTREERFLSSQRSLRQLETEREYSEKTHFKLANRMAEENLRCG